MLNFKVRDKKVVWESEDKEVRAVRIDPVYPSDPLTFVIETCRLDALGNPAWDDQRTITRSSNEFFWLILKSLKGKEDA